MASCCCGCRGNFLYDEAEGRINLIDFGAARHYPAPFVGDYLEMVRACADRDRDSLIARSISLGFLTGSPRTCFQGALLCRVHYVPCGVLCPLFVPLAKAEGGLLHSSVFRLLADLTLLDVKA